jgi:hypothetical protein
MAWTILTSCLYMEMLYEMLRPYPSPTDPNIAVFSLPAGEGAVPLICLEDLGQYARWIFNTPHRSNGIDLEVATQNIKGADLAAVFTEVTGRRAMYHDVTLDEYFASGGWPNADEKVGHSADHADTTLQTYRQNFSGFWNFWKAGGGKDGKATLDYKLLDDILPGRVKTVKEWMEKTGYTGDPAPVSVLKDYNDAKTKAG